jgi:hypothetical protein
MHDLAGLRFKSPPRWTLSFQQTPAYKQNLVGMRLHVTRLISELPEVPIMRQTFSPLQLCVFRYRLQVHSAPRERAGLLHVDYDFSTVITSMAGIAMAAQRVRNQRHFLRVCYSFVATF